MRDFDLKLLIIGATLAACCVGAVVLVIIEAVRWVAGWF